MSRDSVTQRDKVHFRARAARDAAMTAIDNVVPDKTGQDVLRYHVNELYSAYTLLSTMGEEPVYPNMVTKLKEEP